MTVATNGMIIIFGTLREAKNLVVLKIQYMILTHCRHIQVFNLTVSKYHFL